jgi:hypothetical protein
MLLSDQRYLPSIDGKHWECAVGAWGVQMIEEHGVLWPVKFVVSMFVLSFFASCALTMCGVSS